MTMILLAHRGYWKTADEKNSRLAFRRAFDLGYGVELDIRDRAGELVISHDAPAADAPVLTLRSVLEDYRDAGAPGMIAVNVKADGLLPLLEAEFARHPEARERCFMFDMSVPETLRYMRGGHIFFTRHSEYEPVPAFADRAAGVWMDCFERPWVEPEDIVAMTSHGLRGVAIVSPELHGRSHLESWAVLRQAFADGRIDPETVMLCTDFPEEAAAFFAQAIAVPA